MAKSSSKFVCQECGGQSPQWLGKCPHCGKKVKASVPVLIIRKRGRIVRTVVLEDGKTVAKSSVTRERSNEPAFIVRRSKKRADAFFGNVGFDFTDFVA